jgi:RNA polymerase sigma-70 factor (ECF subfamily)
MTKHAFHTLLPQHAVCLHRRALRLTSNPHQADDLVQATLLKAWASRDSYSPDSNLRAWLFTILRNTFFSDLRKRRKEIEDVDGSYAAALFEEPRQDHVLALKELIHAMAQLPEAQRRPLVLMGAYGFSQLEAAEACDCTVGTIKSRVSRSRATLSHLIAHDGMGSGDAVARPQSADAAARRQGAMVNRTAALEPLLAPARPV